jgi:alpha-ribazole phosphatase
MELNLIRHPRPVTEADVCIGQLDVECAAGWEAHADRLARVMAPPERVYTSPSRRCRVLAERLASGYRLRAQSDPRLLELNFGDWEGRRWADIGHGALASGGDSLSLAPPGGETWGELLGRVEEFLAGLPRTLGQVAIVTHSGPVRAALVHCLALPPAAGTRFEVGYGRLTRLKETSGEWRLEVLNA